MKKGQINIQYSGRRIGFSGEEKLIGQAERYSTIAYDAIVAYAAKAAAVPESSITMAMEAIYDAVSYFVLNGHSVQIPNLGTFSIGVRAKSAVDEASFTANFANNLRGVNINFLPDSTLKTMLKSTAISTQVDATGYTDQGVVSVRSGYIGAGSNLCPMQAGKVMPVAPMTRIIFSGTRLKKDYIGSAPVALVFIMADGTERSYTVRGESDHGYSFSYSTLTVKLAGIKEDIGSIGGGAKFLKSVTLKDDADNVYYSREFATPTDAPAIGGVNVDGAPVNEGATIKFEPGMESRIVVYGANFNAATEIKIGTTSIEPSSISDNKMVLKFSPTGSGNYPISVKSATSEASVYNLSFGSNGGVSIASITANGDALVNGGTTNIIAGTNYAILIAGTGLSLLEASEFTVPAGSTLQIVSASDTLIQANILNAQAGDFILVNDGVQIFRAALVAVTPTVAVTGYKIGVNGAVRGLGTKADADPETGGFGVYLVGTELDELTVSSFSGASNITYNGETGELEGTVSGEGDHNIVITHDGTTIATLVVNLAGEGGDDY